MASINHVAIYLRKSRDDENEVDVLSKHRQTLYAFVKQRKWTYDVYEEIVSGDSLDFRPQMKKLLERIEDEIYDGVVVMEIDRLSRGDDEDRGKIFKKFARYGVKVITPQEIYDLDNEDHMMRIGFWGFMARMEYMTIKKRLKQGKIAGAKQGKWTNGKPPFPYEYHRDTKTVSINPEKLATYRLIVEKYINEPIGLQELAVWLNLASVPSLTPDSPWSSTKLHRLLTSQVHLGKIVYQKTRGNFRKDGKVTKRSTDEWIVVDGQHEQVKTEEEHIKIMTKLQQNSLIPKKARPGVRPLTGILYCAKCNHRMQFREKTLKDGSKALYALCAYQYSDGRNCGQVGHRLDNQFFDALFDGILSNVSTTVAGNKDEVAINELRTIIGQKQDKVSQEEKALKRVYTSYEDGVYSSDEFALRRQGREAAIKALQQEIQVLNDKLAVMSGQYSSSELKQQVNKFKKEWKRASSPKQQNSLLKSVVTRILYDRNNDNVDLRIIYK